MSAPLAGVRLLVSAGAGLMYVPAGLIVAGLGLVAVLLLTLHLARHRLLAPGTPSNTGAPGEPAEDVA